MKMEVLGEIMPENKKSLKHLLGKHLRDFTLWEHTGSNRGPSACKADALNQLSYAPVIFGIANICDELNSKKFNIGLLRFSRVKGSVK